MEKIKVGISIGDINGVGAEIILKIFSDERMLKDYTPIVYASTKVISYHKNLINDNIRFQGINSADTAYEGKLNVLNCWNENANISLGQVTEDGGKFAYIALEKAVQDIKNGLIDTLVTAPIHKKAMNLANFPYAGHTEFITKQLEVQESLMTMVSNDLRVAVVTSHIPVKDVANKINKKNILKKLRIFNQSLKEDFGVEKPIIAVLGLNPHAGDGGVIGKEEIDVIIPTLEEAKSNGIMAMGPYPADGFFGSNQYKKFDGILAMYHDQGLIPFKAISFGEGVNYTAGIPIVRTSPDHGTAFDIVGKNMANIDSMRKAIYLSKDIYTNRKNYQEDHANKVEHVAIENEIQPEDE